MFWEHGLFTLVADERLLAAGLIFSRLSALSNVFMLTARVEKLIIS